MSTKSLKAKGVVLARSLEGGNGGRIWENADPDVTILKQAKEEYAKLQ
jgi:hypothetical protein